MVPVDRTELKRGLSETRRYLLSHHEPGEWYRCYRLELFGRTVRLCARCTGIYPGILVGLLVTVGGLIPSPPLELVAILPAPALVDWILTTFTDRRGYNVVRTVTGSLLGFAYGTGLGLLLDGPILPLVAIGAFYGVVAASLLFVRERRHENPQGFK
jgi:uncharacterized membrane protein